MNGLGIVISTFDSDLHVTALPGVTQKLEDLGYDRVYTSESLTDALSMDMLIANSTKRIGVGSFVAIIYNRHPHIAAQAAAYISDVSGGRFILGLGLGHAPRVRAMGLTMGNPQDDLRRYVAEVRELLAGQDPYEIPLQTYQGHPLQFRTSSHPVPIYTAAVGPKMAELGGEISDGIMFNLVPRSGIAKLKEAVAQGARKVGRDPAAVEINLGLHAVVSDDLEEARERARLALTYWLGLPAYNNSVRDAGFVEEAARLRDAYKRGDQEALRANITNEIVDEFCVVGPAARCREGIDAFRAAGADFVALHPDSVNPAEGFHAAIERTAEALAPGR